MKVRHVVGRLSAVALLVALGGAAHAQGTISVNFSGGTETLTQSELAGVVSVDNWTNVGGASGTVDSLVDNVGDPTSADLFFSSAGDYNGYNEPSTGSAGTDTVYRGGIFGTDPSDEVLLSITGIPYAKYNVYVYASQDSNSPVVLSDTDGTTTYYYETNGDNNSGAPLLLTTSTDPASPTVGPAQYQIFGGLTSSTFTLSTAGSVPGVLSNNVFGVQIQDAPEPSTLPLIGAALGILGCLAIPARRRGLAPRFGA